MLALRTGDKMREAMASEMKGVQVGGEGRKAEIDGGYFGGYVKPANRIENRRDRRLRQYQSGKRKVVVVIRRLPSGLHGRQILAAVTRDHLGIAVAAGEPRQWLGRVRTSSQSCGSTMTVPTLPPRSTSLWAAAVSYSGKRAATDRIRPGDAVQAAISDCARRRSGCGTPASDIE
jgi:hypothetical protein